jgi:hypothetical protein
MKQLSLKKRKNDRKVIRRGDIQDLRSTRNESNAFKLGTKR